MVYIPKLTHPLKILNRHLKNDGHVLSVLQYITPITLRSVNVCNPTAPTIVQPPGGSSIVAARLIVGPLPRSVITAIGHCWTNRARVMAPALKWDIQGASSRVPVRVSVSCSRHELAEPEAAAAEREPRIQAQDKGSLASTPVLPSRLSLNAVKMYAQVVPELTSLLDHMERKSPMLVISTTDASMGSFLQFQLPPEYGCIVLGFFDVESVEVGRTSLRDFTFSYPWTSVRVRIALLPQVSNRGNLRGGCDYAILLHRMRQTRVETWFHHGG